MASDLSTLIQDGICNTLNGLLAKDAVLKETNKAVKEDMPSINLLKVESTFEFDNITSLWTFFIPAYTASYIFNTMLGDDSEPILEIDDDIADAMNEFISNLSGGLTTAINGENFEDLGQSKFVVSGSEKLSSETIEDFDNMYKFSIDLEGKNLFLFIQYDEIILPFLSVIASSEESVHEEEEQIPEENPEEEMLSPENQDMTEEINSFDLENDAEEPSEEDTEKEEEGKEPAKKDKKLKLVIIAIASLLALTIIAGIIMYFTGVFDEPEIEPAKTETSKTVEQPKNGVKVVQYEEKPDFNFQITDINKKRLNAQLEALTKYEVLNEEEIAAQKAAEKERLYQLQKEQELLEFAAKNKEEDIFTKKDPDPKRDIDIRTKFSKTEIEDENKTAASQTEEQNKVSVTTSKELSTDTQDKKEESSTLMASETETKEETKTEPEVVENKMKFVLVESLKYRLYNQLISQVTTKDARISICNNENGRTVVYIGPFSNKDDQNKMVKLIQEQNITDAIIADISQEEFDARCSFE